MKELLERLKVADTELWEEIVDWVASKKGAKFEGYDTDLAHALIQDCCQRAIVARGWGLCQGFSIAEREEEAVPYAYIGKLEDPGPFKAARSWGEKSYGESPAMALLAAYLEAVEA